MSASLQESRIGGRPVICIENYTIYCGDADERKGSFEDLKVKRQAPSALGLVHIDRPRYAVNEEPPTNFAIDDIMRRVVDQCPACIVLAPSGCPLADLGYADNVVTFVPITDKTRR
ncbi:hypothetical protein RB195_021707 [Necator americanus]|uniref:Uncharacterized protein n=1 Tax=Necator americanus TaxID=51031 RepID=A0ABR1ECB8_NECAM